jgi:hypothetical protein
VAHIGGSFPPLRSAVGVGKVISGVEADSETEDNEAPDDDDEVILSRLCLWGEEEE